MRRLALLVAGGALWLILAALPTSADGGPHQLALNNGTSGLNGDCAACHRAHTAQAAMLLKAPMPDLCTNCHDGSGATTDVVNGVQYVPDGAGNPTGTVLGALRGGGFSYALIDTANPARMMYSRSGGALITFSAAPTAGSFTITLNGNTTAAILATDPVATIQTKVNAAFGTSTAYSSSTAPGNMSNLPAGGANVIVSKTATTVSLAYHNALRTARQPLPTVAVTGLVDAGAAAVTAAVTDNLAVSATAKVGVRATGQATTSTHEGSGTVWGNGSQGSVPVGATGVVLECSNCHNPHGNGQYRILDAEPGAAWTGGTGVANWTAPTNAVEIADGVALTAGQVRNYTVKPGALTTDVTANPLLGDYLRRKYDPSGAANFTNFYLKADDMTAGWNGTNPTNKAANGGIAPANSTGLMTAWCITCHTRYNGWAQNGTASLVAQTPIDQTYMFKHGTTGTGCEMCHVSHGSNARMTAQFSSAAKFPDGSAEDSALLKVDNRGTCNLCHDPTGTLDPGVKVGPVPGAITPGP